MWAWGCGGFGELGNGGTATAVPVQVSGLTDVTAIAAGGFTGYALRGDGTVWAWGDGSSASWATAAPPQPGAGAGVRADRVTAIAAGFDRLRAAR